MLAKLWWYFHPGGGGGDGNYGVDTWTLEQLSIGLLHPFLPCFKGWAHGALENLKTWVKKVEKLKTLVPASTYESLDRTLENAAAPKKVIDVVVK